MTEQEVKNVIKAGRSSFPGINLVNFRGQDGSTILHLIVRHGEVDQLNIVLNGVPSLLDVQNTDCYTPLHLAVAYEKKEMCEALLKKEAKFDTKNVRRNSPLDSAIFRNNMDIVVLIINSALRANSYDFVGDALSTASKEFLENFLPLSKKGPFSNYINLVTTKSGEVSFKKNASDMGRLFKDCVLTSEEESSDSEGDEFVQVNSTSDIKPERFLYRGIFFHPDYFKKAAERREARKKEYHDQPVYSWGTRQLARRTDEYGQLIGDLKADQLVRNYFQLLKFTPKREERYKNSAGHSRALIRPGQHRHHHDLFIMAYKNSYSDLVNKEGLINNFNFFSNDNPFVSTSEQAIKAMEYVTRALQDKAYALLKHRCASGTLKHRRFGYLIVFHPSQDYLDTSSINLSDLNESGVIKTKHFYKFDGEVCFESSIPKEAVLGYQVFAMPSFRKAWSGEIFEQFGLNKAQYNACKELLKSLEHPGLKLKIYVDMVVQYQLNKLSKKLAQLSMASDIHALTADMDKHHLNDSDLNISVIPKEESLLDESIVASDKQLLNQSHQADLEPFDDHGWLSDTHMRIVGDALVQNNEHIFYAVTPIFQDFSGLKRGFQDWLESGKKFLCVALHCQSNHWVYAFFDMREGIVVGAVIDPLSGSRQPIQVEILRILAELGQGRSFVSYSSASLQGDSFNCGVWVLSFLQVFVEQVKASAQESLRDLFTFTNLVRASVDGLIQERRVHYSEIYARANQQAQGLLVETINPAVSASSTPVTIFRVLADLKVGTSYSGVGDQRSGDELGGLPTSLP